MQNSCPSEITSAKGHHAYPKPECTCHLLCTLVPGHLTKCQLSTPFASSTAGRVSSSNRALALAPVPTIASILGGLPCQLTPRATPSFGCVRFGYRKCAVFSSFGSGVTSFPLWLASTSGRRCPVRPAFACIVVWAP